MKGEHTLFIRTKRLFLQKETLLPSEKNLLVSEGNIACIRGKRCLRQRKTVFPQAFRLFSSYSFRIISAEKNIFLHGEKSFSLWRHDFFSIEIIQFRQQQKVTRTVGNPTTSPLLPSPLSNKNPQLQGNDGPTSRRPRNNSANPIMVDYRFMKQRC